MTARENILAGIKADAQKKADSIIAEAKEKAAKDNAETMRLAEIEANNIIADAQKKAEAITVNADSAAALLKRDCKLQYKSNAINRVLELVVEKINGFKDADYFTFLYSLAEKNALKNKGVLFLNKNDTERDTAEFREKIGSLGLSLSEETREIKGGFILQYSDILINCSLEALINERKEKLIDVINKQLFN